MVPRGSPAGASVCPEQSCHRHEQDARAGGDIINADIDGTLIRAFPFVKYPEGSNYATQYPKLTEYLKNNSTIVNKIEQYGDLSSDEIKKQLKWGKGPVVDIVQLDNYCSTCSTDTYGLFQGNHPNVLLLDVDLVNDLESTTPSTELADAFSFLVGVTVLHEFVHYSEYKDGSWNNPESGELFEADTYGQTVWRSNADIILKNNN